MSDRPDQGLPGTPQTPGRSLPPAPRRRRDLRRDLRDDRRPATDISVGAYLEARSLREDALVRDAMAALRTRVATEVRPPAASEILARAGRGQAHTLRRRAPLVAAAAVLLVAGTGLALTRGGSPGPSSSGVPMVAASGGAATPAPGVPSSGAPASVAVPTVVVTVTTTPSARTTTASAPTQPSSVRTTPRRAPSTSTTRKPSATTTSRRATTSAPVVDVPVYVWQSTLWPSCGSQHQVTRSVPGTPTAKDFTAIMRSVLSGATATETAQGYVSPFGASVEADVDATTHTVDFRSKAGINSTLIGCRESLQSLLSRAAADNGFPLTVTMEGSGTTWAQWKLGLH